MKKNISFLFLVFLAGFIQAQNNAGDFDSYKNAGAFSGQSVLPQAVRPSTYASETEESAEQDKKAKKQSEDAEISPPVRPERFFELGFPGFAYLASADPFGFISAVSKATKGQFSKLLASDVDVNALVSISPLIVKVNMLNSLNLELFSGFKTNIALNMDKNTKDAMTKMIDIADTLESGRSPSQDLINNLNNKSGSASIGISSFAEIGAGASTILFGRKLYVRAAPSLYFPVLYARKGTMNFKFNTTGSGASAVVRALGDADFRILTPFVLDSNFNAGDIFSSPGLDITLEGRYALWRVLETGLSVSNIPLLPAKTKYETSSSGIVDIEASAAGIKDNNSTLEFKNSVRASNTVMRPVRFDAFGIIKPFETLFFYIKPNIGYTLLNIVEPEIPLNFGVEAGVNLKTILSASLGIHHTDGLWEHAIRAEIDFRFFEVDIIAGLSGPEFLTNGWVLGLGVKSGF